MEVSILEQNLKIFGIRLKQLRESHNLTTRELGELVGTSNATISRYEKGDRDPDLIIAYNIATYFNVTVEYLCGEDIKADDKILIDLFHKLKDDSKKEAMKYITYLFEKER